MDSDTQSCRKNRKKEERMRNNEEHVRILHLMMSINRIKTSLI